MGFVGSLVELEFVCQIFFSSDLRREGGWMDGWKGRLVVGWLVGWLGDITVVVGGRVMIISSVSLDDATGVHVCTYVLGF
jgi:hypothetical protein